MVYEISQLQKKHAVVKGLMSSKNTSSLISEALKSPIGSTSRKKAQKIVSLMRRYRANDGAATPDGQGGPGYQTIEQPSPMAQASQGEIVIFPSPPEMQIPMDGRGGPGLPGLGMPVGGSAPNPLSDLRNFMGNFGAPATIPTQPGQQQPAQPQGGFNIPALKPASAISTTQAGSTPATTQPSFTGALQPVSTSPNIPWGSVQLSPAATAPQQTAFQNPDTQQPQDGSASGGGTGSSPQPGSAPSYPGIQGAVDANQGPDAFALSMLSNPDAMRKLPGFANMPADAIPTGASLAGQVEALSDTLKKEYGLDELLNQKNTMIKNGATLTTDLTDYIRGRDQFLNQTQGMIDQYTNKMRTMDLANPNVAGRANQYMNYLYELRGRQNKRYVEFLNSSVGMYNAQLQDVSNNYDKALSAYESELTLKSNVTQTEYQMYYTALTGMYNAAQQAPILAKQSQLLDAQINLANAQAIKDGTNQGKGLLDDLNTIKTKADGIFTYETKSTTGESKSLFMPTVSSLSSFVDAVSGDGSVSPSSAMQYGVSAMLNGIDQAPDANTTTQLGSKYIGWAVDLYKNAASEQDATNATLLRSSLQSAMSSKIKSGLEADTGTLASLRGDLNSMINPGFFSKGPSQTAFTNRYSSTLGYDMANSLWAGVNQFKTEGGKVDLPPVTNSAELASWIADIGSDSYVANIWNTALSASQ